MKFVILEEAYLNFTNTLKPNISLSSPALSTSIPQVDGNMSLATIDDDEGNVAVVMNNIKNGHEAEVTNPVAEEVSQDLDTVDLDLSMKIPAHFDGVSPGQLCVFCDQEYTVIDEFSKQLKRFGYITALTTSRTCRGFQ